MMVVVEPLQGFATSEWKKVSETTQLGGIDPMAPLEDGVSPRSNKAWRLKNGFDFQKSCRPLN